MLLGAWAYHCMPPKAAEMAHRGAGRCSCRPQSAQRPRRRWYSWVGVTGRRPGILGGGWVQPPIFANQARVQVGSSPCPCRDVSDEVGQHPSTEIKDFWSFHLILAGRYSLVAMPTAGRRWRPFHLPHQGAPQSVEMPRERQAHVEGRGEGPSTQRFIPNNWQRARLNAALAGQVEKFGMARTTLRGRTGQDRTGQDRTAAFPVLQERT